MAWADLHKDIGKRSIEIKSSAELNLGDYVLTDGEIHEVVGIVMNDIHMEPPGFPSSRKHSYKNSVDLWAVLGES